MAKKKLKASASARPAEKTAGREKKPKAATKGPGVMPDVVRKAAKFLRDLERFDRKCFRDHETDVGVLWEYVNEAEHHIAALIVAVGLLGGWGKIRAGEKLV